MGKTALLEYLAERASGFRIARTLGVQAEMELPFAAVGQLCSPSLEWPGTCQSRNATPLPSRWDVPPAPRQAQFLVGLAVLGLLSEAAEQQPLVALVDDAQWLDTSSSQAGDAAAGVRGDRRRRRTGRRWSRGCGELAVDARADARRCVERKLGCRGLRPEESVLGGRNGEHSAPREARLRRALDWSGLEADARPVARQARLRRNVRCLLQRPVGVHGRRLHQR